ncbi:cation acetate symporter [Actinoplanes sp. TBRC 11911]|uniref:solute symporter family protein n=1 Tax=Actinoplanes sp. TBRC 11911 TaxID=2729386 RepID=UPI00145C84F4|nr:cation acetate symporter [Actinoplanes sp. TBRC 11911]NMO54478.1 cation acetate symporter [Actinoplanes sp. TBRC 11911]
MEPHLFAAEADASGSRGLTITLFLIFVAITLAITIWASRQTKTATDFYAGGRQFSGFQNGMAIGGDYMSAASFLGIAGLIALFGYDGFLYSIGFLVAWLVALLLVAEYLRNSGRYTMADVLAFRMRQRPVRTAASVSTVVVSIFYLIAQMVGAGALVSLLLGIKPGATFLGMDADTAKVATIILVGALMIIYVTVGGMKGTTYVQIVKAFMLMTGALVMTILVLVHYKFNLSSLLGDAAAQSGKGDAFLEPGLRYGVESASASTTFYSKMDLISLGIALVLGTAGLPHILTRFYTVPTARIARKSVLWAIGIIGVFYLFTLALGFGAAALVGGKAITAQDKAGNTAAPQLAQRLGIDYLGGDTGGSILLAVIAAVAFATILAVVAGLTLASSSSVAHDFYANVMRRGQASERQEVGVARVAAFVIGAIAITLSIFAQSLNVAFLVALAFAVAASANLPTVLYSLFWKRFNTSGALWSIYGGLSVAVLLVFFSPVVSGSATAMFPGHDWHWFPLSNPGIISIPAGFFFGWLGTVLSKEDDTAKYAELEVRSLTGYGAH